MGDVWILLTLAGFALLLIVLLSALVLALMGWNRRAEPAVLPTAWDVEVRSRRCAAGPGRAAVRDGHVVFTPSGAHEAAWAVPVAGAAASRNYTPTRWPVLLRTPSHGRIFLRVRPVDHDLERSPWDHAPTQRHAQLFLSALREATPAGPRPSRSGPGGVG